MTSAYLEAAIAQLPIPDGPVRISAAHLVTEIMGPDIGQAQHIARLSNSEHKKGRRRFDALGGAVALTQLGCNHVERAFGATDIKFDEHDRTWDARFVVPSADMARQALAWLAQQSAPKHFESSPRREVYGELGSSELEGFMPVLPAEHPHWKKVEYEYLGVALQPPTETQGDTSANAGKVPSRRLFHLWRMLVSEEFYSMIVGSEQMAILTDLELATTNGGQQKGNMTDGTPLANNLGLSPISPV